MSGKFQWSTVGWVLIGVTFGMTPFLYNGVFFPQGHLVLDVILFSLAMLWAVYGVVKSIFRNKVLSTHSVNLQENERKTYLSGFDLAFTVYVITYILSLFHSVDPSNAVRSTLDAIAFVVPYVFMRRFASRSNNLYIVFVALGISSLVIDAIGLANAWGQLQFPDAFAKGQGRLLIQSVFQYHNAFAAFAASVTVASLTFAALRKYHWKTTWLFISIAGLNMVSLFYSGSRGALALWLLVMMLALIGLRGNRGTNIFRVRFVGYTYISALGAGLAAPVLHDGLVRAHAVTGWTGIGMSLFIPALIMIALRWVQADRVRQYLQLRYLLGSAVVLGLIGFVVKYHSIMAKLHSYNPAQLSVAQRFIFWGDGLKIVRHSPLFGSGGGAWASMFQMVQSYPYWSEKVHSFVINTMMDVGIVGLLALLLSMWPLVRSVLWPYKRSSTVNDGDPSAVFEHTDLAYASARALAAAALMLFVHAMMDWDMSFSFLMMVFIAGIAAAVSIRNTSMNDASSARLPKRIAGLTSKPLWLSIGALVIAVVPTIFVTRYMVAEHLAVKASQSHSLATKLTLYRQAHEWAPYDSSYLVDMGSTYGAMGKGGSALTLMGDAVKLTPYNPDVVSAEAVAAYGLHKYQEAFDAAKTAFRDAPFEAAHVSTAINAATAYGLELSQSNASAALGAFSNALNMYAQYKQNLSVVEHLPAYLPPRTKYTLSNFTYDSLAAAELAVRNPAQAIIFAKRATGDPNEHTADVARLIVLLSQSQLSGHVAKSDILSFVQNHPSLGTSYKLLVSLDR